MRSCEAQVSQIPQLRGILEVERNRLQKLFALHQKNLQISQHSDRTKKRLPSCKLAAVDFGIFLNPQYARSEGYLFKGLEWMQMKEN